jgi:hypothetical protein
MTMRKLTILSVMLLTVLFSTLGIARGDVILNFQDISIPGGTDSSPFFTYSSQGFVLIATGTGGLTGFEAHGPNSTFFMGEIGIVAFSPTTTPDNVIRLTRTGGTSFSLKSIDLARNFLFDPAPTVTFTGAKSGGGTVTQSFAVTTPLGVRAFQTFDFIGFTDLVLLSWDQPVVTAGLHQFTDIVIATPVAAVPEPPALALLGAGLAAVIGFAPLRKAVLRR